MNRTLNILLMGGTRFVGKALVKKIISKGYDLTLFTRGNNTLPENVDHIQGDRDSDDLLKLKGKTFDVIIDSSGRNLQQSKSVLEITGHPRHRFLYVSSAGVYSVSERLPLIESSPIDSNSRHIGKAETEEWLVSEKIPFTSFRPTYIYGAGNYNPIEKWFFDRLTNSRPIPVPCNGQTITQLGHVDDLAESMVLSLGVETSLNKIYNSSGKKAITFNGLVQLAANSCGIELSKVRIKYYNPTTNQSKSRKFFPLRITNFFTDISQLESDLAWSPNISLEEGFKDSFINDYLKRKENDVDFSIDNSLDYM